MLCLRLFLLSVFVGGICVVVTNRVNDSAKVHMPHWESPNLSMPPEKSHTQFSFSCATPVVALGFYVVRGSTDDYPELNREIVYNRYSQTQNVRTLMFHCVLWLSSCWNCVLHLAYLGDRLCLKKLFGLVSHCTQSDTQSPSVTAISHSYHTRTHTYSTVCDTVYLGIGPQGEGLARTHPRRC